MDNFNNEEEPSTIFESFSDVALCTLAVALLLVTLLAINITQSLNVQVNRNTFSGGVMRPSLHLECTKPDFSATTTDEFAVERVLYANTPYVAVHLFSPSLALIATDVRGGGTVALGENETFAQQQDLSLYQFMLLAPGIDPGMFVADGQETALLLPAILDKQMVYEPGLAEGGYRANSDRRLTLRMLAQLWPIYSNPIFPVRRPEEYSQARTRVFIETQTAVEEGKEEHYIVIGHSAYRLPEALDDGSLAWLGGFSSGLTEIVFLGETWSDPQLRTNKRIAYFEKAGFSDCAEAYREYAFPNTGNPEIDTISETLARLGYPADRVAQRALYARGQKLASAALLDGSFADNAGKFFPPLMAYPAAWKAYLADCQQAKTKGDPPKWFYSEFLDRLGFDRLAIQRTGP